MSSPSDEAPDVAQQEKIAAVLKLLRADAGNNRSAWKSTRLVVVENERLLLTTEAERMLVNYLENTRAKLDQQDANAISRWQALYPATEKLELLRRCRIDGIDKAFSEKGERLAEDWMWSLVNFDSICERAGSWAEAKGLLTGRFSHLLMPQVRDFLAATEWLRSFQFEGTSH